MSREKTVSDRYIFVAADYLCAELEADLHPLLRHASRTLRC